MVRFVLSLDEPTTEQPPRRVLAESLSSAYEELLPLLFRSWSPDRLQVELEWSEFSEVLTHLVNLHFVITLLPDLELYGDSVELRIVRRECKRHAYARGVNGHLAALTPAVPQAKLTFGEVAILAPVKCEYNPRKYCRVRVLSLIHI